ncbi:hypothetical protein [Streptomyces sp. NPDC053560]|uniref:hypothetical protein n=1 Tax=Streptomyces sp. NPDC053560 TaxID=3365711 RepID=UPI0037D46092
MSNGSSEGAKKLLAEAAEDYGTPKEREERAGQARLQSGMARSRASHTASSNGRRRS